MSDIVIEVNVVTLKLAFICVLVDPGNQGSHCPPKRPTKFIVLQRKTDFRTNWPTPQVVQMQKKRSASARDQRLCALTPLEDPCRFFTLRAHHGPPTLVLPVLDLLVTQLTTTTNVLLLA